MKESVSTLLDLKGKVAVVTGGRRGIGAAISLTLAQAGANVVVVDLDAEEPRELVRSIKSLGKGPLLLLSTDVGVEEDVKRMVKTVLSKLGKIDILVNNAGIFSQFRPEDMKEEDWDRVFNVNLKGAFLCSREVARHMIKRGSGGRIINIASVNAFLPETNDTPYDTSKAGLVGLTKDLALNWGKYKINVNAVAPGLVYREGIENEIPERVDAFTRAAPLGELVLPKDIANMVLFLASEASSKITGQTIAVDGGIQLFGYMSVAHWSTDKPFI